MLKNKSLEYYQTFYQDKELNCIVDDIFDTFEEAKDRLFELIDSDDYHLGLRIERVVISPLYTTPREREWWSYNKDKTLENHLNWDDICAKKDV